ncbi:hypothetical protein AYK25_09810 [Thermoplasmatales archaeon SM1-50]|nr:MAG: hypothetical protein AYK25_09810 [Thermoplasmatales archaeon SM1-50]
MRNKFKAANAGLLIGFILVNLILVTIPPTSAGPIFAIQSTLNVTWGDEIIKPIVPRGELRTLTLVITHTIAKGALGEEVLNLLTGSVIPITITITDASPWCTAVVSQGTLSIIVQPDTISTVQTTVSIQVANDAPAYGLGYIKIKATAAQTSLIEGTENTVTLSFIPEYKALIQPSLPETNVKEIGPMDTAVFPIEITNLGNARTIVLLNVTNVSKDWNAVITTQLILDEGGGTGTAYLVVKPPKSFGYHYDEQTIRVSMQPVKADDYSKKGQITYETFLIQSRGFSLPGFEILFFLGALIIVLLLMVLPWTQKK